MQKKLTAQSIRLMKGVRPIVCVTAYDEPFARIADLAGIDLILVGDSVGMVSLGMESTLTVSIEDMVHHTKAVKHGITHSLLVADMPFGSYGGTIQRTVDSASALMKAGASAVKLEGLFPDEVQTLVKLGIPVMGHLGFTPQSIHVLGGPKVQGRDTKTGSSLVESAKVLEEAGAFSIVLELTPIKLSQQITEAIGIPTIGIGAGPRCDGQIQVIYDLLGLSEGDYKHAKKYAQLSKVIEDSLKTYSDEVRCSVFPLAENGFE